MINEITDTVVKKVRKGVWRMPRLTEAMKDVISCDKLRVDVYKRQLIGADLHPVLPGLHPGQV